MECQCSLNNNYKIIELCDIEKFNEQIEDFLSKSWTQLTIPENLIIPDSTPHIKDIKKVHLNIKIHSTKIIETPKSNIPNTENLKLTGKLLLIAGEIYQKIFYVSETNCSRIHFLNCNNSFTTYITLDENADVKNDSYCVYACVENFFIKPVTPRSLTKSVSLFLFAHKTINPLVIQKLPNTIIVKSKNNEIVLTIDFNKETKKFIVKSTKKVPNPSLTEPYFTLLLEQRISGKEFIKVTLNSNEDGEKFKELLNDKEYPLDLNRLLLFYNDKSKIEITNYPNSGNIYIPSEDIDMLEITENGLVNRALNSKIKIVNDTNDELSTVRFMSTGSFTRVIATSTNNISTNKFENTQHYAQMLFYGAGAVTANYNAIIFGKQNAQEFAMDINKKSFGTGFPIKLNSKFPNKIIVTNYKGQTEYLINEEVEFLTNDLLNIIPYDLNYNKITLKNRNNSNVLFVYFDGGREKLFIYSTGVINVDSNNFSITIKDSSEKNIKLKESISLNQNADRINTISVRSFTYGDILELNYSNGSLIEITDIPNKGDIFNPTNIFSKFVMTRNGLTLINS